MSKFLVLGAKKFKGNVEGVDYDSTTIFLRMRQDDSKGMAVGFAGQELKFGDSTNFDKIKNMVFPFEAEVELETITTGKQMKTIVVDFRPIQSAKP